MQVIFSFSDGREVKLVQMPERLELLRDADTPADGLELTYAAQKPLLSAEPCGVHVERNGKVLFDGILDEHAVETEAGRRMERFVCRSRAALLLDNEAVPGEIQMPSVRTISRLFLEPHGLQAAGEDLLPKRGRMVVERGTRCWTVICTFAEKFLRTTPYCTRNGTVCFSSRAAALHALPPLKKLAVIRKPCAQISRVVVQNARTGAYSAVYENPAAKGVDRIRFLSARADTAPAERIEAGEREALQAAAVAFGYCDAEPGDRFDFSAQGEELPEMALTALRYICTAEEEETEMTFIRV